MGIIERELAEHGALAALVRELSHGLVVVFPDGRHDGDDRSGKDPEPELPAIVADLRNVG